jgi:hypothetical protein
VRAALLVGFLTIPGCTLDAQPVRVLDYFVNTTPACAAPDGPCVAGRTAVSSSPCLEAAGYLSFEKSVLCARGASSLVFVRKGGDAQPWGLESFSASDGWLRALDEVELGADLRPKKQRVFRDRASGRKGVRILPLVLDGALLASPGKYVEEHWFKDGVPSCWGDEMREARNGSVWEIFVTTARAKEFLFDCRGREASAVGACPGPYDVDLVVREEKWGRVPDVEVYVYGRWHDPRTGRDEGLGPVYWEHRRGSFVEAGVNDHLVNARFDALPCWTCPDP